MTVPSSYAYQWKSTKGSVVTNVGTNTGTYKLATTDVGATITCAVTGTNTAGSTLVTTPATVVVGSPSVIPTTGNLANRIIFGGSGGSAQSAASVKSALGTNIYAFNTYASTMGAGGASNFPAADAAYALANNVELHISWDQINTSITFAQILSGGNDASIIAFGNACAAHGKRILLRMWWEMNGSPGPNTLVPPSIPNSAVMYGSGTTLAQRCATWIEGWQYIYNKIKVTCGATNVLFWFCPNGNDSGTTMESCWPGLNYVDVTGMDDYNNPEWGPWATFPNLNGFSSGGMWSRLLALAPNLPMGLGETGCTQNNGGNTQDAWLTSMFTCQSFPNLHWVDYFDYNLGDPNWSITTSASLAVVQQYAPLSLPAWSAV